MNIIAIDTNIFYQLLSPGSPAAKIAKLLKVLSEQKYYLCLDIKGRISAEYSRMLLPVIKKRDETGFERQLVTYWLSSEQHHIVELDFGDKLMQLIQQGFSHSLGQETAKKEVVDRIFVYVSCKSGCWLITDDREHILTARESVMRQTRSVCQATADFIDSDQAYAYLLTRHDAHH